MTFPQNFDPDSRLISFTANYSLNGPYSASAVFADCDCRDDVQCGDVCGIPLAIKVGGTVETVCCTESDFDQEDLDTCFESDPDWVYGLLNDYRRDTKAGTTSVRVRSFFEHLNRRPICTQQFCNADFRTVLATVTTFYAGLANDITCLDPMTPNNKICGPVQGNSILQELAGLAQAACSNLFVQVGGCLTIERWKDNEDPVELVIPESFIMSAQPANYTFPTTNVIRVRGSAMPRRDCGTQQLTKDIDGNRGPVKKCVLSGVPTPCANVTQNNLFGEAEDIKNATIETDQADINTQNEKKDVKNGSFNQEISSETGFDFSGRCLNYSVKGQEFRFDDGAFYNYDFGPNYGAGYGQSPGFLNNYVALLQDFFPVPFSNFGLGAFGTPTFANQLGSNNNNNQYQANQPSYEQCETVVISPVVSECGPSSEDLQNKYVPCKEVLFKLALRRYQENLMAANTWNVEIGYLPCIRLNQMVEFTVPQTADCPAKVIKGIVGGIRVEHSQRNDGECTSMKLAIMGVDCLNQTAYTSGNLVQSMCAGENSGTINPWNVSPTTFDQGSGVNDCIYLYAFGASGLAFAEYTHPEPQEDCDYDYSFDYEFLQGATNVNFDPGGSGIGVPFGGGTGATGTITGTTQMTDGDRTFSWQMAGVGVPTYVKITNFRLTKTVMA